MTIKYQPVVTDSIAKQIAEQLREAIVAGRLKVNDRLPTEEELAAQFGVSRPTLRDALKRLAAQNLIRSRRGPTGGNFVRQPTDPEVATILSSTTTLLAGMGRFSLAEIAEARQAFEMMCARMAAERRDSADLERMRAEIAFQNDPKISDEKFCESDVKFHHAVVESTKNPVLTLMMAGVLEALQPPANLISNRFRERHKIARQHKELCDAIEARDGNAAAAAVTAQIVYLVQAYAEAEATSASRHAQRGRRAAGRTSD
jgi:GntR family transcriptional regulator, transcriptional repressor for pyruvate dehydrogenase complex